MESARWRREAGGWSWRKLTCSRRQNKKRPKRAEVQWQNIKGPWGAENYLQILDSYCRQRNWQWQEGGRKWGKCQPDKMVLWEFFFLRCQRITLAASGQSPCARKCICSLETAMLCNGKIPRCRSSIMGRILSITSFSKPRYHVVKRKTKHRTESADVVSTDLSAYQTPGWWVSSHFCRGDSGRSSLWLLGPLRSNASVDFSRGNELGTEFSWMNELFSSIWLWHALQFCLWAESIMNGTPTSIKCMRSAFLVIFFSFKAAPTDTKERFECKIVKKYICLM